MPESKRTYEAESASDFPLRLKKSGSTSLPKRPDKRRAPARPEPDPTQNVDLVMRLIDHLKNL